MNCRETRSRLSAYLDREIDLAAEHAVRDHIRACAACKQLYATMEAQEASLGALARLPVPEPRTARAVQRWRDAAIGAPKRTISELFFSRWALGTAGALAAATVVLLVFIARPAHKYAYRQLTPQQTQLLAAMQPRRQLKYRLGVILEDLSTAGRTTAAASLRETIEREHFMELVVQARQEATAAGDGQEAEFFRQMETLLVGIMNGEVPSGAAVSAVSL